MRFVQLLSLLESHMFTKFALLPEGVLHSQQCLAGGPRDKLHQLIFVNLPRGIRRKRRNVCQSDGLDEKCST